MREDVTKVFNLRLPEPLFLKLQWLAAQSPDSMQRICLDAVEPAIDRRVKEMGGE